MSMTGMIQWGMRQGAEVTNQLMSVERILEYTFLTPEPNLRKAISSDSLKNKDKPKKSKKKTKDIKMTSSELNELPSQWPTDGRITFVDVSMRYADDEPPVLKQLNLTIEPSEKVK